MRKTDQKRQHILDTARRLFQKNGFANTSMSEITAEAGGSKATVYNYFPSKEELFVACMTFVTEQHLGGIFETLKDPKAEVAAALLAIAKRALRYLCSPDELASRRLLIAEADRSGIGKMFYSRIDTYLGELAVFLRRAMDEGHLRRADPLLAAYQLRALVEGDIVERCLMGAHAVPPSAAAVTRAAKNAVTTFLRAYGPAGGGETQAAEPAQAIALAPKPGAKRR